MHNHSPHSVPSILQINISQMPNTVIFYYTVLEQRFSHVLENQIIKTIIVCVTLSGKFPYAPYKLYDDCPLGQAVSKHSDAVYNNKGLGKAT